MSQHDESVRCVVLGQPDRDRADAIDEVQQRTTCELTLTEDPVVAFASVCMALQAGAARATWGLAKADPPLLLIVQPEHWSEYDKLLNAMVMYAPHVPIHLWQQGRLELLPVTVEEETPSTPSMTISRAEAPIEPPEITAEEIQMLLTTEIPES